MGRPPAAALYSHTIARVLDTRFAIAFRKYHLFNVPQVAFRLLGQPQKHLTHGGGGCLAELRKLPFEKSPFNVSGNGESFEQGKGSRRSPCYLTFDISD